MLHISANMCYSCVVLVTISDIYFVPEASIGASIMPIDQGLRGSPFQRDHVGPASADRSEGSGGGVLTKSMIV